MRALGVLSQRVWIGVMFISFWAGVLFCSRGRLLFLGRNHRLNVLVTGDLDAVHGRDVVPLLGNGVEHSGAEPTANDRFREVVRMVFAAVLSDAVSKLVLSPTSLQNVFIDLFSN